MRTCLFFLTAISVAAVLFCSGCSSHKTDPVSDVSLTTNAASGMITAAVSSPTRELRVITVTVPVPAPKPIQE